MATSSAERTGSVLERVLIVLGLIFCSCSIVPGILYGLKREDLGICHTWDKKGITAAEVDSRLNKQLAIHDSLPWTDENLFRINNRQCDDIFRETFILVTLIVFFLDVGGLLLIYALRTIIWSLLRKLFTCGSSASGSVGPTPFDYTAPFVDPDDHGPYYRRCGDDHEPGPLPESSTNRDGSKRLPIIPEAKSRPGNNKDSSKDCRKGSGPTTDQVNVESSHQDDLFDAIMKERERTGDEKMWEEHGIQKPPKAKFQSNNDGSKAKSKKAAAASETGVENMKMPIASRTEEGKGKVSYCISEDLKPALLAMLQPLSDERRSSTKKALKLPRPSLRS